MKKFVLFTLVLVLITAFALTAFQAPVGGIDGYAVGWNNRISVFNAQAEPAQSVAFLVRPPIVQPNVGWNS
jgi:opacity protein-like surface antigen